VLRVTIVAVGKVRTPGLAEAIEEYENRLRHYVRFEAISVNAANLPDDRAEEAMTTEGRALMDRVPAGSTLIALTRDGKRWTTRNLAEQMEELQTYGGGGLTFAIGGAQGLDVSVLRSARARLSLSAMTLPHELARLVLTEQLYRSATILRGEPYHKGP
jgi:23S rRNA (pseudouridine1915-N3)-methyltransferase